MCIIKMFRMILILSSCFEHINLCAFDFKIFRMGRVHSMIIILSSCFKHIIASSGPAEEPAAKAHWHLNDHHQAIMSARSLVSRATSGWLYVSYLYMGGLR